MIRRMVVFGATGDLTARYLLPGLAHLHQLGRLSEGFAMVGSSRDELSDDGFREQVRQSLERHAPEVGSESRAAVAGMVSYRRADVTDAGEVRALLGEIGEALLAYLALPPSVYAPAIEALTADGLPEGSRLVIEKPFGEDLESAQSLNRLLAARLPEEAVFRVDHFLGMHTVQNILGVRFSNRIFECLWNADSVERVEIVWDETLGLEGRAGYYDSTGALIDMIQNHLLQLLCLVAMEAPLSLGPRDLRDRKVDVLRAVRPLTPEDVARHTVRGRYAAGRIGERELPAYRDEDGVEPERATETFAQVTLFIDNWRWTGVPFVLRSGKALGRDRREIAVHFRPVPHLPFEGSHAEPNVLRLELEPERIGLSVNVTRSGERLTLGAAELSTRLPAPSLPAYGRLILDGLRGDCTLSIRADEAEEAWRIVDPIAQAWRAGRAPLLEYPAGSEGPAQAD